jgi:hypothetical protein
MLKHILTVSIILVSQATATFALGGYSYTDNVAASQTPPASVAVTSAPQFVVLGIDDNKYQDGVEWATGMMRNRVNPKGTGNPATFDSMPTRASFYLMALPAYGNPNLKKALADLYYDGNELGDHTLNHFNGVDSNFTVAKWKNEMTPCLSFLTDTLKIAATDIWGFRTPFLAYNNNGFSAAKEMGFVYDCSIEEGEDTTAAGTTFVWPYTLDKGSPGADFSAAFGTHEPVDSSHKGVWEMPSYIIVAPPDSECAAYGLTTGFRHRLNASLIAAAGDSSFDTTNGKMTGLDCNIWFDFNITQAEFLAILKYNLDQRLKTNRAPFLFGAHSDFYSVQYISEPKGCKTTYQQRRQALEQFLDYAFSKPEVRVVRARDVISWMRNPVVLGGNFTGPCTLTVTSVDSGSVAIAPQKTSYAKNEMVTLTATPAAGWYFDRWAGTDIAKAGTTITVPMYKNITVKAVFKKPEISFDTTTGGANLVTTFSWLAESDDSSKVLRDTLNKDTAIASFNQFPTTDAFIAWISFTASQTKALTTTTGIEVEYQCDKPLIVQFVQPELENDESYAMYQVVGPATTGGWYNLRASVNQFYQPDWTPLASKVSLKLNTVKKISFIPSIGETGDQTTLKIRKLRLFTGTAGVRSRIAGTLPGAFAIRALRPGVFAVNVPATDKYTVTFFSINGSVVTAHKDITFTKGDNILRLGNHVPASGVYIATIRSKSLKNLNMKLIVK